MPAYQSGDILLNKYRIEKIIGSGSFGEVYLATHLKLNAPYAIKVLHKHESGVDSRIFAHYQKRFELEARLGARVHCPNVIKVDDFEQEGEELVLRMEYAPGGSLEDWLEKAVQVRKPMEIGIAVRQLQDIAQGLAALHENGVVHRDLKPSNILFAQDGTAKLGDLGVAQATIGGLTYRVEDDSSAPRHPGTPAYMSPEQETSLAYLPQAADIYSLGIVLFLALTFKNPKDLPPGARLRQFRPDAPPALERLLADMLEESPKKRPFNGAELTQKIDKLKLAAPRRAALPVLRKDEEVTTDQPRQKTPSKPPALPPEPPAEATPIEEAEPIRPAASPWKRLTLPGILVLLILAIALAAWQPWQAAPVPTPTAAPSPQPSLTIQPSNTPLPTQTFTPSVTPSLTPSLTPLPTMNRVQILTADPFSGSNPPACLPGRKWRRPSDGMIMVCIPAGEFWMGSPMMNNPPVNETPVHRVYLDAFWMDQTEVTNGMYRKCVDAKTCSWAIYQSTKWDPYWGWVDDSRTYSYNTDNAKGNLPMAYIRWGDAQNYCKWAGDKLRLPTEAEWEKAARGDDYDPPKYPWGNQPPDKSLASFAGPNSPGAAVAAGSYPPGASKFGVLDMAGNVWEWTSSKDQRYPYQGNDGREDLGGNSSRIARGGAFNSSADMIRSAFRWVFNPDSRLIEVGFRCVWSAAQSTYLLSAPGTLTVTPKP